ncbi:NUDIX hydrolase [Streptomyces sp. NPDC002073]
MIAGPPPIRFDRRPGSGRTAHAVAAAASGPVAFREIRVRVAAVVFDGGEVALIRRSNGCGETYYSLPGGNVEPGEPLAGALNRELREELALEPDGLQDSPVFTWLLDAMVTRPGPTPPRKLHVVYRVFLKPGVRSNLNTFEDDDTGGCGEVVWIPYGRTRGFSLYPPAPIAALDDPAAPVDAGSAMLRPLDDTNYRWI